MEKEREIKEAMIQLTKEMATQQKQYLLKVGREFVPRLTEEDVLQPNDYELLEESPAFRYEEGLYAGILSVQSALQAELYKI